MVKKKKVKNSQATARKQEGKKFLCSPGQSQHFSTKPKRKDHQKLSLQLFQLNKSTQFSYQHHFITVINKKKHTDNYSLYRKNIHASLITILACLCVWVYWLQSLIPNRTIPPLIIISFSSVILTVNDPCQIRKR